MVLGVFFFYFLNLNFILQLIILFEWIYACCLHDILIYFGVDFFEDILADKSFSNSCVASSWLNFDFLLFRRYVSVGAPDFTLILNLATTSVSLVVLIYQVLGEGSRLLSIFVPNTLTNGSNLCANLFGSLGLLIQEDTLTKYGVLDRRFFDHAILEELVVQLLLVSDGRHEVSHYSSGCHLPKTNLNLILVKFFDV